MTTTTALAPSSSKAAFKAVLIVSAPASEPALISPRTSTMAVCGVLGPVVGEVRDSNTQAMTAKNMSQARRKPLRQRRALRCSCKLAKAKRSRVLRSQAPALAA
jgi:hypothetical protein